MNRESDLLFGLLALQMNFISKEQLLEAAAVWMNDPSRGFPRLLQDKGYLKDYHFAAVKAMVEARLRDNEGDAGRSLAAGPGIDAALRESLLALKSPDEFQASIARLRPVGQASPPARGRAGTPAPRGAGVPSPVGQASPPAPGGAAETLVLTARPVEDRYELRDEIGRGGLGRVVEAFDRDLKREVAVKLVLDDLPAHLKDRFVREAEITARVDHPNVVPVIEFGEIEVGGTGSLLPVPLGARADKPPVPPVRKSLFLSMKRIRGRDLGALLRSIEKGDIAARRSFSRKRLLVIFQDICHAIAYAHSRGVLHRDLKPANVMVGDFGETLVVDWGLAKRIDGRGQGTGGRERKQQRKRQRKQQPSQQQKRRNVSRRVPSRPEGATRS